MLRDLCIRHVNELEITDASAYPNPLSANLTIAAKSEIEKHYDIGCIGKSD